MDATASGSASETSSVDSSSSASSATESGSESVGESGSTSVATSESGSDSTTGVPISCNQATDVNSCNAASHDSLTCIWLPSMTWVGGGGGVCESVDVGPTGICAVDEQDDGCGSSAEPTCPDEFTSVWYQEVGLEVGAIEIVSFTADQICESPGGNFQQCMYDAQTSTFTPPECSCGCPMGE